MFGLMRAKTCGMSDEEKHFRRLHYCGTCKTIGSLYGQKARFLLNHDTVFLAEILTSLSDGGNASERLREWQSAYQSYNCLSLPKQNELPLSLEFAATANLVLTEFKLADKVTDENSRLGKIAQKGFSNNFVEARKKLEAWQISFERVQEILSEQEKAEADSLNSSRSSVPEILNRLSRPTAEATALFFREGARLIGKIGLADTVVSEIGFAFGKLIYLLDAFEDYEKDFRRRQFNAIRAAFKLKEAKLSAEIKRKISQTLYEIENEIAAGIRRLPIAENRKSLFVSRLSQNLRKKLKTTLPVIKTTKKVCVSAPAKPKKSFSDRWKIASRKASELARNYSWQMPAVFLFVFTFALVAPASAAQVREAKTARECFDLSFNLMFLGVIFGSVLAFPRAIMSQNLAGENIADKAERKRREGWCDWCDCECCECCGCCEGCDGCCCCDCDNCGCDGCCDCSCD